MALYFYKEGFKDRDFHVHLVDFLHTVQLVRIEGLEPPRLAAPEPKSGASANSAISAFYRHPVEYFSRNTSTGSRKDKSQQAFGVLNMDPGLRRDDSFLTIHYVHGES
jgi:hypothetical protein